MFKFLLEDIYDIEKLISYLNVKIKELEYSDVNKNSLNILKDKANILIDSWNNEYIKSNKQISKSYEEYMTNLLLEFINLINKI